MFKHALTLVWNRRRSVRLVIVEVAAAFLVVFVVLGLSLHAWITYQRPLGFIYEDIWDVRIDNDARGLISFGPTSGAQEAKSDILAALRQLPGVVEAHSIALAPFNDNQMDRNLGREGAPTITLHNILSADALAALDVRVVEGRLFGPQDQGQSYRAVLVNRAFVEQAFGGASPIGKRINFDPPEDLARVPPEQLEEMKRELRPVGIIEDFRQQGEFAAKTPYAILLDEGAEKFNANSLFVKVKPGTDRRLEERIVATVRNAAVGYNAWVTPWKELRATNHLETLLPLRTGLIVAAFLLSMVALGLIGIVWQDVVRRTNEIGVRRAAGASAAAVRSQILLESLIIGAVGILIGSLLAVQIPLLSIIDGIDWAAALPALGLATLFILMLGTGAALYPAHLASRREPVDALRYE